MRMQHKRGVATAAAAVCLAYGVAAGQPPAEQPAPVAPAEAEPRVEAVAVDVPTRIAELVETTQMEFAREPNQWRLFVDVAARYAGISRYAALSESGLRERVKEEEQFAVEEVLIAICGPGEADVPLVESARAFLTTLEEADLFRSLDELTRECRFVPDRSSEPLIFTREPHLGNARQLAKLLAVKMRLAAVRDDGGAEFLRAFGHVLALSRACCCTGSALGLHVGMLVRDLGLREVRAALLDGRLGGEAAAAVLRRIDESAAVSALLINECERIKTLDEAAAIFAKKAMELGELAQQPAAAGAIESARGEAMRAINAAFDFCAEALAEDQEQAMAAQRSIEEMIVGNRLSGSELARPVIGPVLPAIGAFAELVRARRADLVGTRLMLALECFRDTVGGFPATLDALIPEYLFEVPRDPCDFGRSIAYRQIDPAGDPFGRSYLIYSVGLDREDNGGTAASPAADAIRSPARGRGTDYILNQAE